MQNIEINLTAGQTVRVGDKTVTILKIEGDQIFFQIDPEELFSDPDDPACHDNIHRQKLPPK